jgi:phosphopantetheinyl transferase
MRQKNKNEIRYTYPWTRKKAVAKYQGALKLGSFWSLCLLGTGRINLHKSQRLLPGISLEMKGYLALLKETPKNC